MPLIATNEAHQNGDHRNDGLQNDDHQNPRLQNGDYQTGDQVLGKPFVLKTFELSSPLRFDTLILDFGDVLCLYADTKVEMPLSPFEVKHILGSDWWHDYEKGLITTDECFRHVEEYYKLKPGDLHICIETLARVARYDTHLIEFVRMIKQSSQGRLQVYMASNISTPDWQRLRAEVESWNIFDGYILSCDLKLRKPDPRFFEGMVRGSVSIKPFDPSRAIFVDDKQENTAFAQMAGITSVVHQSTEVTIQKLQWLLGSPHTRGTRWLQTQQRPMWDRTDNGLELQCQFTQLVMLQMHGRRDLVKIKDSLRTWNTFFAQPILTTDVFPDDLDSTTFALMLLDVNNKTKHSVMDEMLTLRNEDGLFNSYFDRRRWRLCPAVNANVLRLFVSSGRSDEVSTVVTFLEDYLSSRAFIKGTRYYNLVDWVFWILSLVFVECLPQCRHKLRKLRELTISRLKERMGRTQDVFSAALRFSAARKLGIENQRDLEAVLRAQCGDGCWNTEPWLFRWGRLSVQSGSPAVLTSAAVMALRDAEEDMIRRALTNLV